MAVGDLYILGYDSAGRPVRIPTAAAKNSRLGVVAYDSLGRPAAVRAWPGADGRLGVLAYDSLGRPAAAKFLCYHYPADDFNRPNGALGADWTSVTNMLIKNLVMYQAAVSGGASATWAHGPLAHQATLTISMRLCLAFGVGHDNYCVVTVQRGADSTSAECRIRRQGNPAIRVAATINGVSTLAYSVGPLPPPTWGTFVMELTAAHVKATFTADEDDQVVTAQHAGATSGPYDKMIWSAYKNTYVVVDDITTTAED